MHDMAGLGILIFVIYLFSSKENFKWGLLIGGAFALPYVLHKYAGMEAKYIIWVLGAEAVAEFFYILNVACKNKPKD